jgi:hypothetical protein
MLLEKQEEKNKNMDFGRFFEVATPLVVCTVAICGVVNMIVLGIKRHRAHEQSVEIAYKDKIIICFCGYVLSLVFISVLSSVVTSVSFAIYWP